MNDIKVIQKKNNIDLLQKSDTGKTIDEPLLDIDLLQKSDTEKLIDALMEDINEKYDDTEKSMIRYIISLYLYG